MPAANVNGVDLHYEEHGEGDPLLLIMGLGGHSGHWFAQVPVLAEHFRVITFDNRGAGRSSVTAAPYSTAEMAEDAAGLLAVLGVERAHVAGWSMGGMIAQQMALHYPERVGRLALVATLARPRPWLLAWLAFGVEAREKGLDPHGRAAWGLPWGLTVASLADPEFVERALEAELEDPYPTTLEGYRGQSAACASHDTLDRLGEVRAPTLVLVGDEDILTPPYFSRELAAGIPGAELRVIERAGHGMPIEHAGAVNRALLEFRTAARAAVM
jgi:pimeloyl-ACP methyl ester carboxylesterase